MHKFTCLFFILISLSLYSQEPLSDGYKNIKLGMSQQEVKSILQKSTDFNMKKEEILSFRMEPDTEIISTEGYGYIIFGYFHFSHDQLFQILLKLSEEKVGYYYLLTNFTNRFGKPQKFSPTRAIWENEKIRIVIEKPCTLKYIYLPVWNGLVDKKDETSDEIYGVNREKFVDDL